MQLKWRTNREKSVFPLEEKTRLVPALAFTNILKTPYLRKTVRLEDLEAN